MSIYKKAPKYEGRSLTLMVGRGDMKIEDGVEYTDSRLAKFVKEGLLVEVDPAEKEKKETVVVNRHPSARKKTKKASKKFQQETVGKSKVSEEGPQDEKDDDTETPTQPPPPVSPVQ